MALVAPGSHPAQVDVAVAVDAGRLPRQLTVHAGSAAVAAVVRRRAGDALGVRLATPLPLVAEDRLVLREPASRRLWSATVESVPPTAGEASTPPAAADDRHVVRLAGGARLDRAAIPAVVDTLRGLAQPFTVSAARQALGGTRREVLPLLEHLDASQRTVRLPDGTRRVVR